MNPDNNDKPNLPDPSELEKLLEIELMQKRAEWQQSKSRTSVLRALSFLFLIVVVLLALLGFFWFLSGDRASELRARQHEEAQPSPSPN